MFQFLNFKQNTNVRWTKRYDGQNQSLLNHNKISNGLEGIRVVSGI